MGESFERMCHKSDNPEVKEMCATSKLCIISSCRQRYAFNSSMEGKKWENESGVWVENGLSILEYKGRWGGGVGGNIA